MPASTRTFRTLLLLAMGCAASAPSHAGSGASELEGRELAMVNDLESGLGSLLGHWLGGGKDLEGEIESVTVVEDAPARLAIRVAYRGFAGGKLWGELQDERRRPQRGIRSEPVVLEEADGEVDLAFELLDGAVEEHRASAFLRLNVGQAGRSMAGLMRTYVLGKSWSPGGDSSAGLPVANEIVLEPIPVGDTPTGSEPPPDGGAGGGGGGSGGGGGGAVRPTPVRAGILLDHAVLLQPKIDLYQAASTAAWYSDAGRLSFNGPASDRRGFVIAHAKKVLADGKEYARVLQTHPEWKNRGRVYGVFSVSIPADATKLEVGLGFLRGANGSDGVTFQIAAQDGSRTYTLLSQRVPSNEVVPQSLPIPGRLKGKNVRLVLTVLAGASSGRDWAAWVHPRIF